MRLTQEPLTDAQISNVKLLILSDVKRNVLCTIVWAKKIDYFFLTSDTEKLVSRHL